MEQNRIDSLLRDGDEVIRRSRSARSSSRKLLDERPAMSPAAIAAGHGLAAPDCSLAVERMVALTGSSAGHAPLVIVAIGDAFLCVSCIARNTGVPEMDVAVAITRIEKTIKITREFSRCDGCSRADLLSRLG